MRQTGQRALDMPEAASLLGGAEWDKHRSMVRRELLPGSAEMCSLSPWVPTTWSGNSATLGHPRLPCERPEQVHS